MLSHFELSIATAVQSELFADKCVETFLMEHQRYFIEVLSIQVLYDSPSLDIAEQADFAL